MHAAAHYSSHGAELRARTLPCDPESIDVAPPRRQHVSLLAALVHVSRSALWAGTVTPELSDLESCGLISAQVSAGGFVWRPTASGWRVVRGCRAAVGLVDAIALKGIV